MAPQESSRETGGPWRARSALDVPSVLSFFCLFPWDPPFSREDFTGIFWSCYIQKKKPGPSITFLLQIERVPRERQGYAAARERGILPHQPGPPHSHPRGAQFSACPWQSAGRSRGGKWGHGLTCRDPASPLNHPLGTSTSSDTARVCVCVSACLCVWDTASFSGEDSFQNSSQEPEVKWEICTPWGLRESLGSEASPQHSDSWLGESA